jgi:hypothetical protein
MEQELCDLRGILEEALRLVDELQNGHGQTPNFASKSIEETVAADSGDQNENVETFGESGSSWFNAFPDTSGEHQGTLPFKWMRQCGKYPF